MARTKGSGWGGGILLYQKCPKCGKKKAIYDPINKGSDFRCTACKEYFGSYNLARWKYVKEKEQYEVALIDGSMGFGTGSYCPDCGGLCGNEKHNRLW